MSVPFPYPPEVERSMRAMYQSLRENDRRRYAAVEAQKLGHGGDMYIATLLECDPKTVRRGHADLDALQDQPTIVPAPRVRKKGAGARPRSRPSRS